MSRRSLPLRSHSDGSRTLVMMRLAATLLCVLTLVIAASAAKDRKSAARSKLNEPFRTLESLDSRLAKLNSDQDELKRVMDPDATKATSTKPKSHSRPWTKPAHDATQTANSFRILAERQQRRYRILKQPYG